MRLVLAIVAAACMGWLAWCVARADSEIGPPFGPDRLIAAMDPAALPANAAQQARLALADRPNDGRAYRVLAQVAERESDGAKAAALYAIAAERWPRERLAQAKLAESAFANGDPTAGLTHLDALLRVAPETRGPVLAALLPAMAEAPFRAAMVARLREDPPWRNALVPALLAENTDTETALALLADLAEAQALSPAELQARVTLLDRMGRALEARAAWLESLTPAQRNSAGPLFDGGFEYPEVSGGYGWSYHPPPGVMMAQQRGDALHGERAMEITFSGRAVRFHTLLQPLVLPPGTYRMQAAADNAVRSSRPFLWRITCLGNDGRLLLELALSEGRGWQTVGAAFEVPAGGCPRQELRLRHAGRSLAERQIRGVLRLDGMSITKAM